MSLASHCPSCGFENPRVWRACARCGTALGTDVPKGVHATVVSRSPMDTGSMDTGSMDTGSMENGSTQNGPTEEGPPQTGADEAGPTPSASVHAEAIHHGEVPVGEEVANDEAALDGDEPTQADPDDADEAPPDTEPPLVGQVEASSAIRTGIERAFTLGRPTLVALEGPRESGKTRLLIYASEIASREEPNVLVLYGSCRKEGGDGPYAPFSRMLLERFGVTPASSPNVVRGQMATEVGRALTTKDPIAVAETTHLLGHVAGVPFPDSPFLGPIEDKPEELRRRSSKALRRLIEGEGQKRPVLVLLDDMHLVGDDGWEMVRALTEAEAHIAVVVAGDKPILEKAEALSPPGGVAIGPIAPLSVEDVTSMLHVLLPNLSSVPSSLAEAITHRAEGNPGAVRELALGLLESELFREGEEGLEVDMDLLLDGALPVTIEDAIQQRLDSLNEFQRATLERAAVVGETFWDGAVLAQMRAEREAPGDDADPTTIWPNDEDLRALNQVVTLLLERGFIVAGESDLPGAREFRFRLAGARDFIYKRLDDETRVQRHTATARWLQATAVQRREGIAALIAPHLERAGMGRRAGRAYLEAATHERRHLRTRTALAYIEKALPLIPSDDVVRKIDALHEHGSLLTTVGRYDEAFEAFSEMLKLAWTIGARGKGGAALNRIARIHRQRGENRRARVLLRRALEMFRTAGDLRGVAATLDDLAQVHALRSEYQAALAAGQEALDIRRIHNDQRGEAVSLTTLGTVELNRGNLDLATRFFSQALEIREGIGDLGGTLTSHNALGIVAYERGDAETALNSWRSALELARQMADRRSESFLLNNIGEACLLNSQLEDASEALKSARKLAQELSDKRGMAEVERNLGRLAVAKGADGAERTLLHALKLAKEYGAPEAIALVHRALGELSGQTLFGGETQSGDGSNTKRTAEDSFLISIDLFREAGNEKEAARSLAALGYHLIERGQMDGAKDRLGEARAIMRRMGLFDLKKVESTLGELGS